MTKNIQLMQPLLLSFANVYHDHIKICVASTYEPSYKVLPPLSTLLFALCVCMCVCVRVYAFVDDERNTGHKIKAKERSNDDRPPQLWWIHTYLPACLKQITLVRKTVVRTHTFSYTCVSV